MAKRSDRDESPAASEPREFQSGDEVVVRARIKKVEQVAEGVRNVTLDVGGNEVVVGESLLGEAKTE